MAARKKIFFLTSRIPFPLEKGDKLRAYHQMRHLSQRHDIHLCVVSNQKLTAEAEQELNKFCSSINTYESKKTSIILNMIVSFFTGLPFQVGYFFNSGAHYFVKKTLEKVQADHIFVQLLRTAEFVKQVNLPKTIDYMDSFSMGMQRRKEKSSGLKKLAFHIENKRLKRYEESIFPYFDQHFIISQQDKESFEFPAAKKINVIPNGVDHEFFAPDKNVEKKYDLIFTGNMSYPPNVSAVEFIAQKILPLIWKQRPECNFIIAGANPSSKVKALSSDKIKVTGWVDDIRTCYNEGKICVTPLNIGTGLQNKLLEAMSMELPCVCSQLANNALAAENGKEIVIANRADDYAENIINLLNDPEKRKSLASNGKKFIVKNYHWESIIAKMEKLMFSPTG